MDNHEMMLPGVALLYLLARRGSVLPGTLQQCIDKVHEGFEVDQLELADQVHNLYMDLYTSDD